MQIYFRLIELEELEAQSGVENIRTVTVQLTSYSLSKSAATVQGLCSIKVETTPRWAGGAGRSNRQGGQEEETDSLAGAEVGE